MRTLPKIIKAIAATGALTVVLFGIPLILIAAIGSPVDEIATLQDPNMTQPARIGAGAVLGLGFIGIMIWAQFAYSIILELPAALRQRRLANEQHLQRAQSLDDLVPLTDSRASALAVPLARRPVHLLVGTIVAALIALSSTNPASASAVPAASQAVVQPLEDTSTTTTDDEQNSNRELPQGAERYTIQQGDTWWDLADRYLGDGMRWNELQRMSVGIDQPGNHRAITENSDRLHPGMEIVVPTDGTSTPSITTHEVQKGESVWAIAQDLATTPDADVHEIVEQVGELNPDVEDLDLIYPGQRINVPAASSLEATPAADSTTLAQQDAASEDEEPGTVDLVASLSVISSQDTASQDTASQDTASQDAASATSDESPLAEAGDPSEVDETLDAEAVGIGPGLVVLAGAGVGIAATAGYRRRRHRRQQAMLGASTTTTVPTLANTANTFFDDRPLTGEFPLAPDDDPELYAADWDQTAARYAESRRSTFEDFPKVVKLPTTETGSWQPAATTTATRQPANTASAAAALEHMGQALRSIPALCDPESPLPLIEFITLKGTGMRLKLAEPFDMPAPFETIAELVWQLTFTELENVDVVPTTTNPWPALVELGGTNTLNRWFINLEMFGNIHLNGPQTLTEHVLNIIATELATSGFADGLTVSTINFPPRVASALASLDHVYTSANYGEASLLIAQAANCEPASSGPTARAKETGPDSGPLVVLANTLGTAELADLTEHSVESPNAGVTMVVSTATRSDADRHRPSLTLTVSEQDDKIVTEIQTGDDTLVFERINVSVDELIALVTPEEIVDITRSAITGVETPEEFDNDDVLGAEETPRHSRVGAPMPLLPVIKMTGNDSQANQPTATAHEDSSTEPPSWDAHFYMQLTAPSAGIVAVGTGNEADITAPARTALAEILAAYSPSGGINADTVIETQFSGRQIVTATEAKKIKAAFQEARKAAGSAAHVPADVQRPDTVVTVDSAENWLSTNLSRLRSDLNKAAAGLEGLSDDHELWVAGKSSSPTGRYRTGPGLSSDVARIKVLYEFASNTSLRPASRITALLEAADLIQGPPLLGSPASRAWRDRDGASSIAYSMEVLLDSAMKLLVELAAGEEDPYAMRKAAEAGLRANRDSLVFWDVLMEAKHQQGVSITELERDYNLYLAVAAELQSDNAVPERYPEIDQRIRERMNSLHQLESNRAAS